MKKKTLLHNKGIAEHSYSETFKSIQLASLYVLYYEEEFDFSKQKIKNFNKILTRHNQEALDHEINALEKQIPKKPIVISDSALTHDGYLDEFEIYKCPKCGLELGRGKRLIKRKHCIKCVQAIDWSEK